MALCSLGAWGVLNSTDGYVKKLFLKRFYSWILSLWCTHAPICQRCSMHFGSYFGMIYYSAPSPHNNPDCFYIRSIFTTTAVTSPRKHTWACPSYVCLEWVINLTRPPHYIIFARCGHSGRSLQTRGMFTRILIYLNAFGEKKKKIKEFSELWALLPVGVTVQISK